MFPSNPRFVLALLAVSSFGNFLVSVDSKCKIEPVDGHVNWPSKKKKIKRNAFKKCKELVTICIPPEVESIHNTAFVKSGLDLTKLYEVPCDADPSPLFSFKGPLQIEERSVEGEPAAVLAAPPTDYFLQFTIELKSISDVWTNIITLTNTTYDVFGSLYGTMVPTVNIRYNSTDIVAQYGDETNVTRGFIETLELNKKSTVLIKVYETTATLSVNGGYETIRAVGPRSQLNDVEFYIGDPWRNPADAIISDISFGHV